MGAICRLAIRGDSHSVSLHPLCKIYATAVGCQTYFASVACQKVHCTKRDAGLGSDGAPRGSEQKVLSAAVLPREGRQGLEYELTTEFPAASVGWKQNTKSY